MSNDEFLANQARSREGRGLSVRGGDSDKWILIQRNTFMNWVNLQLQSKGLVVTNFETDFDDGVKLCALIEALQNRTFSKVCKKPMNPHQSLGNVTLALNAVADDNVRLVNIGSEDIVTGSLKLILGLVWTLILRYQIGKTKIPPKKLMLAWLKAVIPECRISNFTSDWNDGVALCALIDYCQPGLFPDWRNLSRHNSLENCKDGMKVAHERLNIPEVVRPEDFSSPHLDELSGMTYLSYYMMQDSPGYFATRREVRNILQAGSIDNFTTDWNDGILLCNLVMSVGGSIPGWPNMRDDPVGNLQRGLDEGQRLGVEPIFTAKEIADPEVDHLGVMAYAAYYTRLAPVKLAWNPGRLDANLDSTYVGSEKSFQVYLEDGSPDDFHAELTGPDSNPRVDMMWSGNTAHCSFTPVETGQHKLDVLCGDNSISGSPVRFRVLADRSQVLLHRPDHACVGMVADMKVDVSSAGEGDIQVEARSPSGYGKNVDTLYRPGAFDASFTPTEVGIWNIFVQYDGDNVEGSPFPLYVFDPSLVRVSGLDGGGVGQSLDFTADASEAGEGDLAVTVNCAGSEVPSSIRHDGRGYYNVDFIPRTPGLHTVYVTMNDMQVKDSPFMVDVVDSASVTLSGDGISLVPVNQPGVFTIHTKGVGNSKLDVDIAAPNGDKVPCQLHQINTDTMQVLYTPQMAGSHRISVLRDGQSVEGSPFTCQVHQSGTVHVSQMPSYCLASQHVTFYMDTSESGSGNIEIQVNKGQVPCAVEKISEHRFKASFLPEDVDTQIVALTFNNTQVEGSPWEIRTVAIKSLQIASSSQRSIAVGEAASVTITSTRGVGDCLNVTVTDPDGSFVACEKTTNEDGDVEVTYIPRVVGNHQIRVHCSGQEISDSPFQAKAYDVSAIGVTSPEDGYVGQRMDFTIDVRSAGEGQLQIMVNGGDLPNDVEQKEDVGVYLISFYPVSPGPQTVDILFNDTPLTESPLSCTAMAVDGEVVGMTEVVAVDSETSFIVNSSPGARLSPEVQVLSPAGDSIPCQVTRDDRSGVSKVTFTPTQVGTYTVSVSIAGKSVSHSPFKVRTYDLSKVKVGKLAQGVLGVESKFTVETEGAGQGEMEIGVSADGRTVPNTARAVGDGKYKVSFVSHQPVVHVVTVTYNGQHVTGSPFYLTMVDASHMTVSVPALIPRDHRNQFTIKTPAANLRPDLKVMISAPQGSTVPADVSDLGDGTYTVQWTPKAVGVYTVQVEYCGVAIGGSPSTVQVYDAALVVVSGIKQGLVGVPLTFYLDANKAGDGNLEIQVTADGDNVTNQARQEKEARFSITFTPLRPVRHKISVTFNGDPVPGSPFLCQVVDVQDVALNGEGLRAVPAHRPSSFTCHLPGARDFDLRARVVSPIGHDVPVRVTGDPLTGYRVDYIPVDVGRHQVFVNYGGKEVRGSPFIVQVFDPALVRVNSTGRAYLSKPFTIYLDQSVAGEGMLRGEVKNHNGPVPCQIKEGGGGRWELVFTPHHVGTHTVHLTINDCPLPGSPCHVDVIDCGGVCISGEGLYSACVNTKTFFSLDLHGLDFSDVDISVIDPLGNRVKYGVCRVGHIFRIELVPLVVGPHTVQVLLEDGHIQGSPFVCQAYDPSRVRIMDVDHSATKGTEIGFTVDTSAAGNGELDIAITHKGQKVKMQKREVGEQRFRYIFFPRETGQFEVKATFSGDNIPGCPLMVRVEEDTPTFMTISYLSTEPIHIHATRKNFFVLHMGGTTIDPTKLTINIEAPTGEQLDCSLVPTTEGDYRVEWTPKQSGRHSVDVLFGGQQVTGSPFYIEVFDVSRIRVDSFFSGSVDQQAGFCVDASEAGVCDQTVRVVSPSGSNLPISVSETSPRCYNVTYLPTESGPHNIFLTYNNVELPACPLTQDIGAGELPPVHGDGLYRGEEDRSAVFYIDAQGMRGEPSVQVDGPNSMAKCSIDPQPDGQYIVTFVPVEVGLYDVQVKWNGRELPGSPYHPKIVCGRKVLVMGGWQHYMDSKERVHLIVGKEKELPFDVSQAGPGEMTAEVKSPSGTIPVTIDDSTLGRSTLRFTPQEEGDHYVHILWSEVPLSNTPFHGYAINPVHDPHKVILTGRGLVEAIVHEEAEFIIDASQAGPGNPEVELTGVRVEARVVVLPIGGGKFRCTYIPTVPGAYLLHITWNTRQLHGSPFKVNVSGAFYPNKVMVTGSGLNGGMLGQDLDIRIDTRKAGPGELTAYCMGPNKVAVCELEDHHDGTFRLIVRPQDVGRHVLQVKYGGEHVRGSPFDFKVGSLPDAGKVRVSGPGVEHGILATYQSRFMVETRGAGAGQLTVRVRGPKGAFQVEMYRDSQKDRTILCRYDPAETGLYIVSVRWSGVDVPGSPFHIHILDTQAELEHVLNEQSFHNAAFNTTRVGSGYSRWK